MCQALSESYSWQLDLLTVLAALVTDSPLPVPVFSEIVCYNVIHRRNGICCIQYRTFFSFMCQHACVSRITIVGMQFQHWNYTMEWIMNVLWVTFLMKTDYLLVWWTIHIIILLYQHFMNVIDFKHGHPLQCFTGSKFPVVSSLFMYLLPAFYYCVVQI